VPLMGIYLNPGNGKFTESVNSEIYVDKTGLISYTNSQIKTRGKYLCVSRPRRFGKSMAAEMLAAYYGRGADSSGLFSGLEIASDASYERHLNSYDVIFLNMIDFSRRKGAIEDMLAAVDRVLVAELLRACPEIDFLEPGNLAQMLQECYMATGRGFVILIDEWDYVFRMHRVGKAAQKAYLDYLRALLKDKEYVALAYMTGILPIHKYGEHSALNMFREYSMINPRQMSRFMGFTQEEVDALCERYDRDAQTMAEWYNGYRFRDVPAVYNPQSVVESIQSNSFGNYWTKTETYEALKVYIEMNYDGLRDAVVGLLAGDTKRVNTTKFANDMVTFSGYQDVLTLLVHLGYLGYVSDPGPDGTGDHDDGDVFIPNKEIAKEYLNAVEDLPWGCEVIRAVHASQSLMEALWEGDCAAVAAGVAAAHLETSHITYNDENALAYTVSLAFYAAREHYTTVRELPSGKGFADLAFIPRPGHADRPAMIIELKWDRDADSAIEQIHRRQYPDALRDYAEADRLLLVGISYDKETREHSCVIEAV
jgi:hypothetical protein